MRSSVKVSNQPVKSALLKASPYFTGLIKVPIVLNATDRVPERPAVAVQVGRVVAEVQAP